MSMFWEFFSFEIKFRLKSLSTYVYFLLWFTLMLLFVSAEDVGPVGNGKILLNGPWALAQYSLQAGVFGIIIIAAIFGTSILRDFQRDTYQLLFTKPISKFAYLGGRWAGLFVATVFAFFGIPCGEFAGSLA
jgi:ABC-type transport system involved in multi-copper enzyme maturation permease subunit